MAALKKCNRFDTIIETNLKTVNNGTFWLVTAGQPASLPLPDTRSRRTCLLIVSSEPLLILNDLQRRMAQNAYYVNSARRGDGLYSLPRKARKLRVGARLEGAGIVTNRLCGRLPMPLTLVLEA